MMRTHLGFRLVGCTAFVAVCAAAHAQINVSNNPNLYKSDFVENFEEFAPEGLVSVSPTQTVGLLVGTPVFGGQAAISLTNPLDGTYLSTYNPTSYIPVSPATSSPWGIGGAGMAGTYQASQQGFGFGNVTNPGGDQYLSDITISLQPGTSDQYFGGYFQAAYFGTPTNLNTGLISFSFFDGANLVESLVQATNPDPGNLNNQLVGMAFTFNPGFSFTSVEISGDFVAMDSLRLASIPLVTPEPAPFAVLGLGIGALALIRRRRS